MYVSQLIGKLSVEFDKLVSVASWPNFSSFMITVRTEPAILFEYRQLYYLHGIAEISFFLSFIDDTVDDWRQSLLLNSFRVNQKICTVAYFIANSSLTLSRINFLSWGLEQKCLQIKVSVKIKSRIKKILCNWKQTLP